MHVIALAMQKGGVTKTTTAAHVAAYIARAGHRVLAVDLDQQANLTRYLLSSQAFEDLDYDLVDVFLKGQPIADVIMPTLHENLELGPSSQNMAALTAGLVMVPRREEVLKRALGTVRDRYDVVILDCAPAADLVVQNALAAADWLVMPLECSNFCLSGLRDFYTWVEAFRRHEVHDAQWLGVILGKVDPKTRIYRDMKAVLEETPFETLAEVPKRVGVEDMVAARQMASETLLPEIAHPYQVVADRILSRIGITVAANA